MNSKLLLINVTLFYKIRNNVLRNVDYTAERHIRTTNHDLVSDLF